MTGPTPVDRRVTTVVITYNRREMLMETLPHYGRPLIVVDNGSDDGTAEAVRSAAPDSTVRQLPANLGAVARNEGVEAAETPYVAFADDDSWWEPGSTSLAADVLDAHPSVGLIAADVRMVPDGRRDAFCAGLESSPLPRESGLPGVPVLGFMACAAVVRRAAFLGIGGFDEVLEFAGEEERVALDLADAGWRLQYVREVVARHRPDTGRPAGPRTRRVARNDVLSAVMRRPPRTILRRAVHHATSGIDGAAGVLQAAPRLRRAWTARRPISPEVERQARLLE